MVYKDVKKRLFFAGQDFFWVACTRFLRLFVLASVKEIGLAPIRRESRKSLLEVWHRPVRQICFMFFSKRGKITGLKSRLFVRSLNFLE